jgi:hypothetical protein
MRGRGQALGSLTRNRCADPLHDTGEVGEIAVVQRVAERSLRQLVVVAHPRLLRIVGRGERRSRSTANTRTPGQRSASCVGAGRTCSGPKRRLPSPLCGGPASPGMRPAWERTKRASRGPVARLKGQLRASLLRSQWTSMDAGGLSSRSHQAPEFWLNHAVLGSASGGGGIRTHDRAFTRCRFSRPALGGSPIVPPPLDDSGSRVAHGRHQADGGSAQIEGKSGRVPPWCPHGVSGPDQR